MGTKRKIVDVKQLYKDYCEIGSTKTCKKHNINYPFLRYTLMENGYVMTGTRKLDKKSNYNFNENYFDIIDTPNKAYLLGILATDGNISTKRNSIALVIHKKDHSIIDFLINELQSNIKICDQKDYIRIYFSSKTMKNSLMSIGITNNKTYTLKYPNIPSQFNYDFIRGCIDGDGCWHVINKRGVSGQPIKPGILLQFTGASYTFLESIQNILMNNTEYTNKIYKIKNKNCYELKFSGSKQCKRIFNMVYYDNNLFCLNRKFNIVNSYYQCYQS